MRILLVKMSSMGDIFHTFPALSDLKQQFPQAEIHWVVEEGFSEIAAWHPAVTRVIPIQLRHWMKNKTRASWRAFQAWKKALQQQTTYDVVIDAQGLLKSGLVSRCAKAGHIHGYDKHSAREAIASLCYHHRHAVANEQHAVERTRQLFAQAFGYTLSPTLNFGIKERFAQVAKNPQKLVFIIGTSWVTKLWNTKQWQALAKIAIAQGFTVEIIWGSAAEQEIAQAIIDQCPTATRPQERMSITAIAEKLVGAAGVIGLDTGFSHLAGALETPTIAIYGPTSPTKVGLIGPHTFNLQLTPALDCMPCHKRQCQWLPEKSSDTPKCMSAIHAQHVWQDMQQKLALFS